MHCMPCIRKTNTRTIPGVCMSLGVCRLCRESGTVVYKEHDKHNGSVCYSVSDRDYIFNYTVTGHGPTRSDPLAQADTELCCIEEDRAGGGVLAEADWGKHGITLDIINDEDLLEKAVNCASESEESYRQAAEEDRADARRDDRLTDKDARDFI